jgi:hypothetical protein
VSDTLDALAIVSGICVLGAGSTPVGKYNSQTALSSFSLSLEGFSTAK